MKKGDGKVLDGFGLRGPHFYIQSNNWWDLFQKDTQPGYFCKKKKFSAIDLSLEYFSNSKNLICANCFLSRDFSARLFLLLFSLCISLSLSFLCIICPHTCFCLTGWLEDPTSESERCHKDKIQSREKRKRERKKKSFFPSFYFFSAKKHLAQKKGRVEKKLAIKK